MKKFEITFADEIVNYTPKQTRTDCIEVEKVTLGFYYKGYETITRDCTDIELWEEILYKEYLNIDNITYNMSNYKKIKLINE